MRSQFRMSINGWLDRDHRVRRTASGSGGKCDLDTTPLEPPSTRCYDPAYEGRPRSPGPATDVAVAGVGGHRGFSTQRVCGRVHPQGR